MERLNNTDTSVGRVNEGFEDIAINSDNTINDVIINTENDLTVDLRTQINIPENGAIENVTVEEETNLHLWLCPSKVL